MAGNPISNSAVYISSALLINLRELTGVAQEDGQERPDDMIDLLLEIKIKKVLLENPPPETSDRPMNRGRKKQIVAKNLLDRLSEYHGESSAEGIWHVPEQTECRFVLLNLPYASPSAAS